MDLRLFSPHLRLPQIAPAILGEAEGDQLDYLPEFASGWYSR